MLSSFASWSSAQIELLVGADRVSFNLTVSSTFLDQRTEPLLVGAGRGGLNRLAGNGHHHVTRRRP